MALPPDTTPLSGDKNEQQRAAQQDVFLREVDDALREDQLQSFASRYGKPLIAIVVLGLASFGGWLYWSHHQTKQDEARVETFVQALDALQSNNLDGARARLAPVASDAGSDASASASRLMLANISLQQGKKDEAIKLYGQVAGDAEAPQPLRDLATIRAVAANFDAMKPEDVVARLKPLAAPGNAWFGAAGELVGMAYLKQGKDEQAGPLFAAIAKDENVDAGLRSRARQLAAVLGVDAVDDVVNEKGEPEGKPAAKTGGQ